MPDNKAINPTTAGNIMKKTTRSLVAIVALAASLSATSVYAGPFSALYVFGDSLSDVGNDAYITGGAVPKSPPYFQGRFSNGPNYADQLASMLGVPLSASLMGGTDYAFGGARTNYVASSLPPAARSFNQQISDYAGNHANADSDALYTLWIGANDMSDVLTDPNPLNVAGMAIGNAVGGVVSAINSLYALGARDFLIPNLSDLGLIPEVLIFGPGASALATSLTQSYNNTLATALNNINLLNLTLYQFDTFSIHQTIINNPGAYGLTNTTQGCYDGYVDGSALPGGNNPPIKCATPNSYFYWDFEHPSAAVHQILAGEIYEQVPEPGVWILLITGFSFLGRQARRRKPV
jgi:outer membrane lipase/esterase